jgi:hypothetical protein
MAVDLNPKPREPMPGLGFVPMPQPEDAAFPMSAALPLAVELPRFKHWSSFWPPLDQGLTSQCVSYALAGALMASPVRQRRDRFTAAYLQDRYFWAQDADEWPGREPAYFGTSVNAGCKAYRDAGFITAWYHAQSIADCEAWVLMERPIVVGTNWRSGYYTPDPKTGVIRNDNSRIVGGHAYLITGYNRERGLFRMQNSWGLWASYGRAWIEAETMDRLLFHEWGDAVGIVEAPL